MNIRWEEEMKNNLVEEITAVDFPAETEDQILIDIHRQIRKRRKVMKITKKQTGVILAAALVVIGAVTAIGAGKIAFYSGGHSIKDEVKDIHVLEEKAKEELGNTVNCPESLDEGVDFSSGIVRYIDAWDEGNNKVGTFPEMDAYYQDRAGRRFTLSVSKPIEASVYGEEDLVEVYRDIQLYGSADSYLFLPPEERPSAEDELLKAEGKLFISYGSSEVERQIFTNVVWDKGDFHYLLSTYEDVSLEEFMEWAKKIIDSQAE